MPNPVTVNTLYQMKQNREKIVAITAYDYMFAKLIDESGVHIILVGDSLGNVIQGGANTLAVTMDEMIYHTRIVSRGVRHGMVIGDMPFMSYQASIKTAMINAGRFVKEAGASAVKLEGGASVCHIIQAISDIGIPVQAHIGLTPQSIHKMGGYKVQRDEKRLIEDAIEVEKAGAFSVVLEGIPSDIADKITRSIHIPTIGIGAGPCCDGQILVMHDLLGLNTGYLPKFVKQYEQFSDRAKQAFKNYFEEVQQGKFPSNEHCY
ncbi:MAG: 3-methyl-2-oxobutanoate hydroxymethyltransferase [Desulfobacterales bacterium]|nr:3-methyl-2-oxobutanoate hydroxymethyltransferase [Desulfobacterales bacterium]